MSASALASDTSSQSPPSLTTASPTPIPTSTTTITPTTATDNILQSTTPLPSKDMKDLKILSLGHLSPMINSNNTTNNNNNDTTMSINDIPTNDTKNKKLTTFSTNSSKMSVKPRRVPRHAGDSASASAGKRRFYNSCHICKCGASSDVIHVRCKCGIMFCSRPRCSKRLDMDFVTYSTMLLNGSPCVHCRAMEGEGQCPNSNCKAKKLKGSEKTRKYSVGVLTSAQEVVLANSILTPSNTQLPPVAPLPSLPPPPSSFGPPLSASTEDFLSSNHSNSIFSVPHPHPPTPTQHNFSIPSLTTVPNSSLSNLLLSQLLNSNHPSLNSTTLNLLQQVSAPSPYTVMNLPLNMRQRMQTAPSCSDALVNLQPPPAVAPLNAMHLHSSIDTTTLNPSNQSSSHNFSTPLLPPSYTAPTQYARSAPTQSLESQNSRLTSPMRSFSEPATQPAPPYPLGTSYPHLPSWDAQALSAFSSLQSQQSLLSLLSMPQYQTSLNQLNQLQLLQQRQRLASSMTHNLTMPSPHSLNSMNISHSTSLLGFQPSTSLDVNFTGPMPASSNFSSTASLNNFNNSLSFPQTTSLPAQFQFTNSAFRSQGLDHPHHPYP